jgi:hypothetical protein
VDDVRFIVAPLRFVWGMVLWAGVLFLWPLVFLAVLIFGIHRMSPEEISLMKVLLVVIGPFAFDFWWTTVSRVSRHRCGKWLIAERSQGGGDYSEAEHKFLERVGKPRHFRNFALLVGSLAGSISCAHLSYNASDRQFFLCVLVGVFSPLIVMVAWRLLTGSMRESA